MTSISTPPKKMELLAPAGSVAVFETAVAAGADAVYIGAPNLHARTASREFSMAEIGAMVAYAHQHRVKVFLAANSLLKEEEIPMAVETLALLEALKIDGLIVQDLGLYRLARKYFPGVRLHASTLLGAHNSLAVKQFERMGFSRVVLARELTLSEIQQIRAKTSVELEVFIHGALCFSYSGLCLFSSALGGKSGLRGRCVQPCRRLYTYAGSERKKRGRSGGRGASGYYFSMNDLAALGLLPELGRIGIGSLKIEGRLRSARYVDGVVRAYRLVLSELEAKARISTATMAAAEELLRQAYGRKTTTGYFSTPQPKAIISPYHSGNIGMYLGRIERGGVRQGGIIHLKAGISCGDRLRLHREQNGERVAFTVKQIKIKNRTVRQAEADTRVMLSPLPPFAQGDLLYKVNSRTGRLMEQARRSIDPRGFVERIEILRNGLQVRDILADLDYQDRAAGHTAMKLKTKRIGKIRKGIGKLAPLPIWLKTDKLQMLKVRLPFAVDRFVMPLDPQTLADFLRLKNLRIKADRIIWALPPIIQEAELDTYKAAIGQLKRRGYTSFQLGHVSQAQLVRSSSRITLAADYTLNILNSQALAVLKEIGLQQAQTTIEADKSSLEHLCVASRAQKPHVSLGMTVYGTPPLFTSRLAAEHFRYGHTMVSPKGERFFLQKRQGLTMAVSDRPFSLLPVLPELAALGLDYVVIDLCHQRLQDRDLEMLGRRIAGQPVGGRLPTFNYQGRLL